MGDRLKDKVAIITGSGGGIGRGIALLMAEEGAKVVVNDLGGAVDGAGSSTSAADKVVKEIKDAGGTAVPNYESVATMQGGENIVKTALDNFGKLDVIVTPAGILRDRMVFNMTEEEWDAVIAVHLKGHFSVIKPACILFRQQRSGRIITFSSSSGLTGASGQSNYGAAKDGIAGLTRVVARDMGRYGVTVNCISPGAQTRMSATVPDSAREIRAQRGIERVTTLSPVKLRGEPEDVAPMVVWLTSNKAAHVNGHIFQVSGGTISLLNHPEPIKQMVKQGRWSVEEIAAIFPSTLGREMVNPAPAQPPAG